MKTLSRGVKFVTVTCIPRLWTFALEHAPRYGYGVVDVDAAWSDDRWMGDLWNQ